MFRKRIASKLRQLAGRITEGQDQPSTDGSASPSRPPTDAELAALPPLQPGRGETPGPNHKQDISREWTAAQAAAGVAPFMLDLRPAGEHAVSRLPGATSAPGWSIREALDALPAQAERVVVYDRDGLQESEAVAAWLREQGWTFARRLVGGFQDWESHGEPLEAR